MRFVEMISRLLPRSASPLSRATLRPTEPKPSDTPVVQRLIDEPLASDPAHYQRSPSETLKEIARDHLGTIELRQSSFDLNRLHLTPNLGPLCTGDSDAYRLYTEHRLFHFAGAPQWIRGELEQICRAHWRAAHQGFATETRRNGWQCLNEAAELSNKQFAAEVGLLSVCSIVEAREVLRLAESPATKFRSYGIYSSSGPRPCGIFTLNDPSLWGVHARRAMREALSLMERAYVLEDLRQGLASIATIAPETTLRILRATKSLDEMLRSAPVQNLLNAAAYFTTSAEVERPRRDTFLHNFLFERQFEQYFAMEFGLPVPGLEPHNRPKTPGPVSAAAPQQTPLLPSPHGHAAPTPTETDTAPAIAVSPLRALLQSVRNQESAKDLARYEDYLTRAIEARITSYPQVYRALVEDRLNITALCKELASEREEGEQAPVVKASEGFIYIPGNGSAQRAFESWLDDIHPNISKKIRARLQTFVDHARARNVKKLKGCEALHEFRFLAPGGHRVFFTYLDSKQRTIAIIGYGTHDVQRWKLPELDKKAITIRANPEAYLVGCKPFTPMAVRESKKSTVAA